MKVLAHFYYDFVAHLDLPVKVCYPFCKNKATEHASSETRLACGRQGFKSLVCRNRVPHHVTPKALLGGRPWPQEIIRLWRLSLCPYPVRQHLGKIYAYRIVK